LASKSAWSALRSSVLAESPGASVDHPAETVRPRGLAEEGVARLLRERTASG
jgi:hypothetical protein